MAALTQDGSGGTTQAFPLQEGRINVTSTDGPNSDGVFEGISLFRCLTDGGLTITFQGGETKAISTTNGDFETGQDLGIAQCQQVQITSGNFHLAI